jgi:hypothetical protein
MQWSIRGEPDDYGGGHWGSQWGHSTLHLAYALQHTSVGKQR